MVELKAVSYEEQRADHFRELMKKAQRKIDWWQAAGRSLNRSYNSRWHNECSEAGMQYNFYKDALEALEDNRFQYETGFVKGFESAQPKWISVEERLPEGVCLTRNDAGAMLIGRVSKCQHREAYRCDDEHGMCAMFDITHWMPLPEAPKEET